MFRSDHMMRCSMFLCIVASFMFLGAGDDSRRLIKASRLVSRADRVLALGNLGKAEAEYTRAQEVMPDLPEAHLGIGHVRMRRGSFENAYASYLKAEACYRARAASLRELRWDRYHEAQSRSADLMRRVTVLRQNIARIEALITEEESRGAENRSDVIVKLRVEVRAMEGEAERLRQIDPPSPRTADGVPAEVYFFIGNALLNLDRIEEAVAAWEEAIVRFPAYALVHNNLAVAYWQLGDKDRARREIEMARDLGLEVNREFALKLEED